MAFDVLLLSKRTNDARAAKLRSASAPIDVPEIMDRQLALISGLWADAVTDVPYYSSLVESGGAPSRIASWQDLRSLPILTRQELQSRPKDFIRRSGGPDDVIKTAGSSGTPIHVGVSQAERDLMRIVKLGEWQSFGYTPESRMFLIWGHSHLLGTGLKGKINHIKRKAADRVLNYRRVDAYSLSAAISERYSRELIAFRPLGAIGYACALDVFARQNLRFRSEFRNIGLKFVLATSEPAPKPDTFDLLQDLFNCPVVQEYGGAEFGQVAFSRDPNGGFKVYSDLNYVELEAPSSDDPEGSSVVVTSLYRRYVPLFRYRVGDAVRSGRRLPNGHLVDFDALAGRINDSIEMNDGTFIHSVAIFHCIHQESDVFNIQMHIDDHRLQIRVSGAGEIRDAVISRIRSRLRQVHPALEQAEIVRVDDVATNRAGKRRWIVDERTLGKARRP